MASRWRSGTSPQGGRPPGPRELLAGRAHDRLPLYASGGTGTWPIDRTVEQARRYVDLGFRGLKLGHRVRRPAGRLHDRARSIRRTARGTRARPPSGSPTSAPSSARCARRSDRTSSSRPTPTPSRSASRRHARPRSTWRMRSRRSICCSSRSRCATTTCDGYAGATPADRIPIAGGECLTGVAEFRDWLPRAPSTLSSPMRRTSAGSASAGTSRGWRSSTAWG